MERYWRRQTRLLDKSIDELNKLLITEYALAYKDIYDLLVDFYGKILDAEGKPLMSHLYAYNKYYDLDTKIALRLKQLGKVEVSDMSDKLTKLYKDNEKILNKEFSLQANIDEDKIKQILKTDWVGDGSTYSDRIWTDKEKLATELKHMLVNSVITGKSIDQYSAMINNQFKDVEFWKCKRLIRTEMNHMLLQSTIDKYKQAGIAKYRIMTTIDKHTCEYCLGMSEKEFYIDDVKWGTNMPPFHPSCRCGIVAVV